MCAGIGIEEKIKERWREHEDFVVYALENLF